MTPLAPPFDLTRQADFWLAPRRFFDGLNLHSDLALHLQRTAPDAYYRLVALRPRAALQATDAPIWDYDGAISPGLFDTQVNGGGGALFNNEPTVAGLTTIARAHQASGTMSWLPTFITDSAARMAQAVEAFIAVFSEPARRGDLGLAGIHLEGPHINLARRGTHQAASIRPIDAHTFAQVARLRLHAIPVLLTLAPECVPVGTIARLVEMGVVVSLGHTAANSAQTEQALKEGARAFTHLFNAMTGMSGREPGVVGVAINSAAWCGLIADGHHVDDRMARLAIRARPLADRMVLVSDAMATWNGPPEFTLYGQTIRVGTGEAAGKLINAEGALAGAHIDLASSVRRAMIDLEVSPESALRMATHNPAAMMQLPPPSLALNACAPLVFWDSQWQVVGVL